LLRCLLLLRYAVGVSILLRCYFVRHPRHFLSAGCLALSLAVIASVVVEAGAGRFRRSFMLAARIDAQFKF
jgi:hypothetical protein